jgi:hypothetical protein
VRQLREQVGDVMSDPRDRRGQSERDLLAACVRNIENARTRLRLARGVGCTGFIERPLRADLLAALEKYQAIITQAGAPVPQKLRAEIDLCRSLERLR